MSGSPSSAASASASASASLSHLSADDAQAVERFRAYLRCRTVHPDPCPGYADCEPLFRSYADELGLSYEKLEYAPGHPIFVLTWEGRDPSLPSIVLSSHTDVVPVDLEKWTKDPWAAEVLDGRIYGRGTQDMKSVGIQYLEALRRLRKGNGGGGGGGGGGGAAGEGWQPLRTLHVLYVPDEEVGGNRGMKLFLTSERVKRMNPALVLDEGLASPTDKYSVFYGERKIWWIRVTATGAAGHGSRFVDGTAVPKLVRVIDKALAYREEQRAALEHASACGCGKQLGDFTSINCTMLSAGNPNPATPQYNVIPTAAYAGFDIRIPATVDLSAFKGKLDEWCAEDEGVSWEVVAGMADGFLENPTSSIAPDSFWWKTFSEGLAASGAELHEPSIFPAATDSRWVRLFLGCPCFGISPMRRTPILLHDHDEFVGVDTFVEGIGVYERLIPRLTDAK